MSRDPDILLQRIAHLEADLQRARALNDGYLNKGFRLPVNRNVHDVILPSIFSFNRAKSS